MECGCGSQHLCGRASGLHFFLYRQHFMDFSLCTDKIYLNFVNKVFCHTHSLRERLRFLFLRLFRILMPFE